MSPEAVETQQDVWQDQFERLRQRTVGQADWLQSLRRAAMERFVELGFPTTLHEQWRFTNLRSLAATPFTLVPSTAPALSADSLGRWTDGVSRGPKLVFVDGRWQPRASVLRGLPAGVHLLSLAEALELMPQAVQAHLGRYADFQDDALTALNSAMLEDGAYVRVESGVEMEEPIHLVMLSTTGAQPQASHARNLIVAEARSRVTVVEHHLAMRDGLYWSNAVTEVCVGPEARVAHYLLEQDSRQAYNSSHLHVYQGRDSRFESHTVLLGGLLVRNNIAVQLGGEGGHSLINGLFVGFGRQHLDNHMHVTHARPHCDSRQYYKGILGEEAHGVFCGRILVRPQAQKTDAKQTNRNLLLSDDAQINTQPQLEIYADDVKCTHGATTGRLDDEALFYLRSRGVSEHEARALLIQAFAHESLDRMDCVSVRDYLKGQLQEHLPAPIMGERDQGAKP